MKNKLDARRGECIPTDDIRVMVDALLNVANEIPAGNFRDAVLLRAEHYMDLVQSWRSSREPLKPRDVDPRD